MVYCMCTLLNKNSYDRRLRSPTPYKVHPYFFAVNISCFRYIKVLKKVGVGEMWGRGCMVGGSSPWPILI